jgi:hypothetical protein
MSLKKVHPHNRKKGISFSLKSSTIYKIEKHCKDLELDKNALAESLFSEYFEMLNKNN